jgi:hypothetical protein
VVSPYPPPEWTGFRAPAGSEVLLALFRSCLASSSSSSSEYSCSSSPICGQAGRQGVIEIVVSIQLRFLGGIMTCSAKR